MFTPDMDAIREWVMSGGMASDLDAATRDGLIANHPDLLRDFAQLFGSTQGQRVLAYLAKTSVMRAPADYRLPAGEALAYANIRQGQNQFFALIVELKELGESLERKPNGTEQPTDDGRDGGRGLPGSDPDSPGWSSFDPGGDIVVS